MENTITSDMIVRTVKVNCNRSAKEALDAIHRIRHVSHVVAEAMPRAEQENQKLFFFKIGHEVTDDELEREYEIRNLKPADPYSLIAVNEADPTFSDEYPNGTHWKGEDKKWYYVAFIHFGGEQYVFVMRHDNSWGPGCWFAGIHN